MPSDYAKLINPEQARIFRIIHRANLEWVLGHGLHCGNSATRSPSWTSIGNQELIAKRATWPVGAAPYGVLNDYVPFYFTPFSIMMHNISTGWNGVPCHPKQDILILVASLRRVADLGLTYLFTDSHANSSLADTYSDLAMLEKIDWRILQARDFRRDPNDPGKLNRYQAEALVHRHCPVEALSGIVACDAAVALEAERQVAKQGASLQVVHRPGWYF